MKNNSLRVLHVLGELKPSGAETMLLAASSEFSKHGVKGEILSTGSEVGAFASRLGEGGYVIHHIPFAKSPAFFLSVFYLMRSGFDVIHLHTERGNFWFGLVALFARRGHVIRTIHSSFAFSGFLRWRRTVQRRIMQWLGVCHVAISESVRRVEAENFGIKPVVIPNWYNSTHFLPPSDEVRKTTRLAMNIACDEHVIVSVGNCARVKNHTSLIEALALLPAEKRPLYLHVGHEEVGEPERQLARQLGIADYVRFVGPLADVRPALYAADVFVMPSLSEGFGVAVVEAMAAALPSILTDVPGLKDFRKITDGAIYASPNATSISKAIINILSMPASERLLLGKSAARDMQRNYSIDIGLGRYVEIYRGNAK